MPNGYFSGMNWPERNPLADLARMIPGVAQPLEDPFNATGPWFERARQSVRHPVESVARTVPEMVFGPRTAENLLAMARGEETKPWSKAELALGMLGLVPMLGMIRKLPMDEASRMARARELGFGEDYYHASKQDISEFVPGYEDRLTFLTPDPKFADQWLGKGKYRQRIGAEDELEAFEKEYRAAREGALDWDALSKMEPGPELNRIFDEGMARFHRENPIRPEDLHGTIYPVRTNVKKTFDPDRDVDVLDDYIASPDTPAIGKDLYKTGNYLLYENQSMVNYLKSKGYDSMLLRESADPSSPKTTLAVFDPKNIRSRFAAFDPAKRKSANILAGATGLGLGLSLMEQE